MHFLTPAECRLHCGITADDGIPPRPDRAPRYATGPVEPDLAWCHYVESALQPREACLLWVTAWGVWPSSENLHLYYRLRQSYGDHRQLSDAPGHLFLGYEAADLVSFLQLGVLNGWDMHLLPLVGYARAFVSHDEFVLFTADEANQDLVTAFAAELGGARVVVNAPAV